MTAAALSALASLALLWTAASLVAADNLRRAIVAVGWAVVTLALVLAAYATELLT